MYGNALLLTLIVHHLLVTSHEMMRGKPQIIGAQQARKEGNVLFNDTLKTFYLQLYGIRHMVKDHSDS